MGSSFRALFAEQVDGKTRVEARDLPDDALPPGEVTIDVAYSSLNYKDGLALTGKGKVIRKWPMVPGIDLAGTVRSSTAPRFKVGDPVVVTGSGLGELTWGGYAQRARVKADVVLPLPEGLDLKAAMAVGTAGFTSALCLLALEDAGVLRRQGEVIVTGAAGGVGSVAVALLAALGEKVVASTGRAEEKAYLEGLGATEVLDRARLAEKGPPLASERWAAGVDSVGGQTLATVLSQTARGGAIAACGMAGGAELPASVFPFILRNVSLLGVESVHTPDERRRRAWRRLTELLPRERLEATSQVVPMSALLAFAPRILAGQVRGRVIVDVNA